MDIYDLYSDLFELGDKRDDIEVFDIITDPKTNTNFVVTEKDEYGTYLIIERANSEFFAPYNVFPFTSNHLGEEYMLQYCNWDEQWYAWGTQFNLSLKSDNIEDLDSRFKSLISFFVYEG
jgi:hypothetical protein